MKKKTLHDKNPLVCLCNGIAKETIEKAIREQGARSLDEIFDLTMAGVGACGGSCRPQLQKILQQITTEKEVAPTTPDCEADKSRS